MGPNSACTGPDLAYMGQETFSIMSATRKRSLGPFKQSPGLYKPSPGPYKPSLGLYKPSPGLSKPSLARISGVRKNFKC